MFNGVFEALGRPDLADRSLLINLHPIKPDKRKTEASLWAEFDQFLLRIMGALLDLTCKAMATMPSIDLKELPRMADSPVPAHAVEEHVPWDRGTVANAMNESREEASRAVPDPELVPGLFACEGHCVAVEKVAQGDSFRVALDCGRFGLSLKQRAAGAQEASREAC